MPFPSSTRNALSSRFAVFLVIGIAVVFHLLTLRASQDWGGDFALYIAHAINIATGQPYSDTNFVYNPGDSFMSPRSYPPVFPVLLSPVYKIFGLNLYAMKMVNIFAISIFLVIFYRYTRRRINSSALQIAVVAAVAFSPWIWDKKDHIQPDLVFLVFVYATFLLADRIYLSNRANSQRYLSAVGVGLVAYFAYGTRSMGLVLIPALLIFDIARFRTISRTALLISAVFAVLYFAQNTVLNTDQSYFDSIKSTIRTGTGTGTGSVTGSRCRAGRYPDTGLAGAAC